MPTSLRHLVVVSALLAGCGPTEPSPIASGSGADPSSASRADSGAGGADAGAANGGGAEVPHGTVPISVSWKVIAESQDPTLFINVPSAASRGTDAAVAYVERTTRRVVLQRFDLNGDRIGSPIALAINADESSNVTLASDGKQYAACWNVAPEVHCSLIDEGGSVHNALVVTGKYATIVARTNGWALAYLGEDKLVRLQPLTPTLALDGSVVSPGLFAQFSNVGPLFAATPSGYALVATNKEEGDVSLMRLSADLQSVVSAAPLAHRLWSAGQLTATDTRAAVSLSVPYGSFLLLLDRNGLTAELPIGGGGKLGTDQALVSIEGGIGAAWLGGNGAVRQRFFANDRDSDVGLEPRTASTQVLGLEEEGDDSYQQLVKVGNQSLLVAKAMRDGSLYGADAIRVAPLKFKE